MFQHEQASEEASTILGDKLQQKMDSVTFAQERMKRQLKDLQEKVQGTPADVTDIKDRIEVRRYEQADTILFFFSRFKGDCWEIFIHIVVLYLVKPLNVEELSSESH